MSLDALVQEIRTRSEAELVRIGRDRAAEEARIATERDGRIAVLREEQSRQAQAEAGRVRAQVLAAATVNARKKVYEAREHKLRAAVDATAELLRGYAGTDDYTETLRRMVAEATDRLGKQLRITGRADDAPRLSKVAGKAFDPSPQPILGGLIAETPDGSRRLDLSFDELLRLREPKVRELLA